MGLARYLRRAIATPLTQRMDEQSQLFGELHVRQLLHSAPYTDPGRLEPFGYKSFSQNDEDGVLAEIFRRIGVARGTFVEFGVEDGLQSNTRLLLYQGWRGLWLEGAPKSVRRIEQHFRAEIATGQLQVLEAFITRENIAGLIDSVQLGELDLLSIDIDGNDYWVWEAIPPGARVVAIEYNAKFRPPVRWVMEYNAAHRWGGGDYHGASLQSLAELGARKGYQLVGCGLAGVNAFFVRADLAADRFVAYTTAQLYNPPRFYLQRLLPNGHPTGPFGPYRLV